MGVVKTIVKKPVTPVASKAVAATKKESEKPKPKPRSYSNGGGRGWSNGGGHLGLLLGGNTGGWQGNDWTPKFKVDKSGGELGDFTGTIKSFNPNKAYGFIECDELSEHGDVFLHAAQAKQY